MKYKHIIWDWNGTLIDDRGLCVKGINNGLKKRNIPTITEETFKEISTFPVEKIYQKVGFDFKEEPFEVAGDEFVTIYGKYFHEINLHANAQSVIHTIKEFGITQSILSAGKQDYLEDWVKHHSLSDYFIFIRGINNHYARGKIELGISLVNELLYNKNEIIMVGDTIHDNEVAQEMGIDCLLLNHGHVSHKRLVDTGCKVLSNLEQVLDEVL